MRSPEEFEQFLTQQIEPRLRDLERERAAVQAKRESVKLPVAWKIASAAIGVALGAWGGSIEVVLIFAGLPFLVDAWRVLRIPDTATPRIRAELLAPVIRFCDPSFVYEPAGSIPRDEFAASGLFDGVSWNRYRGEDLVSGRHGSTAFRCSELAVTEVRKRGKPTETEVVFRGLFFTADFNKAFAGRTVVLPDRAERRLGAVGRAFQSIASGAGLELVELEDPEFESAFVVRSTDPTEARYLLSPSLMRRILAFHTNTGSALRLSFIGGHLRVAVPLPGDLFAIAMGAPLDVAQVRAWMGELLFATSIVDELDLNTRIWSKAPAA
jgi:hypothetical protein